LAVPEALDSYLEAVRQVLNTVTAQALEATPLDKSFHELFRHMILATAWQESCWRQFVLQRGQITYLKSGVGASGMMQVNERVWHGIYDLKGLRWDIKYNARAGAEIVEHYLNDYAIAKKEHSRTGGIDNLARATYAIYNGGPGQMTRYRNASTKPYLKKIDTAFWEKYEAVSKGRAMEVAKCFGS
jgi:soluble lytic murein transglycosylase-like protein